MFTTRPKWSADWLAPLSRSEPLNQWPRQLALFLEGSSMRRRILVRTTVGVVAALLLATRGVLTSPAQATPAVARDPAVITTWDAIAVRTIIVQGLKPLSGPRSLVHPL